LKRGVDY